MTVIDSRVKNGILKFTPAAAGSADADFSCQVRAVKISPSAGEAGDNEEVLCGDIIAGASGTTDDKLEFTLISDWGNLTGYQAFSWANRGATVGFQVQFDGNTVNLWTGTVVMAASAVGGEVNEKVTVDESLQIVSLTPPPAFGDGALHPMNFGATVAKKGAAGIGDIFATEPTITGSDSANAAKLAAAGFVANPATAWGDGEGITVGGFEFHWDGSAWVEGITQPTHA